MTTPDDRAARIALELAREIGFDLAGIAPFGPPPDARRFEDWLARGDHGSMAYLERGRAAAVDPRTAWPEGKSLLVVGLAHSRPAVALAGGGRIARYAAGRDYHNVAGKKLRNLRRALAREGLAAGSTFVDATPLLERSHAASAGLGFASKSANLLHPSYGPWFFLGELILEVEASPTEQPEGDRVYGSCGTCTACIDECPTGAIVEPGRVDARRCISYATIEHRGLVDHELREKNGAWAFGCDVCSEVCPWGSKAPDVSTRYGIRPEFDAEGLDGAVLAEMVREGVGEEDAAQERYFGSPLKRPGADGRARNAAIASGHVPTEAGREALVEALGAERAMVRAAALWALARAHLGDRGVRDILSRALAREPDAAAALDMRTSLDRAAR